MATAKPLRRYWDSDCVFGFLADQASRAEQCDRVLRSASEGGCEIIVSALTIAEVLHLKGQKQGLPREQRQKIRDFLRRSIFVVANVDRFIAERAQDLYWDYDIMPKDAVHVATALSENVHYLETFD